MDILNVFIVLLIIFTILSCIELAINMMFVDNIIDIPESNEVIHDDKLHDQIIITNDSDVVAKNNEVVDEIKEHFISKLITPVEGFFSSIGRSVRSSRPFSGIFESFSHGEELLNTLNPLTYDSSTKCRCVHNLDDSVEAFVYRGKIYLRY